MRLDALKCFNPPHVVFDGAVGELDSAASGLESSPLSRDGEQKDSKRP